MKRNKFALSHYCITTGDMGILYPLTWYEVIPGDTVQQATSLFMRAATLVAPVMHPVRIRVHHFYVPFRILMDDWEDFRTGGMDGLDSTTVPYVSVASVTAGTFWDHMGIKPGSYSPNLQLSALLPRAYNMIWNEFYRDQDIDTEAAIVTTSGADATTDVSLRRVAWEKDYFTSARSDTQLGTEVTIPVDPNLPTSGNEPTWTYTGQTGKKIQVLNASQNMQMEAAAGALDSIQWEDPNLHVSIAKFREAMALGKYAEARMRYGARYVEWLRHLGVRSSDGRLQLPEYLGGGRNTLQFSEVLRTGNVDADTTEIGDLHGHGISAGKTRRWRRYFEEDGVVMTLMSAVPKTIYADAMHRGFVRTTKEMYHTKELEHIGDQEIYNYEAQVDHSSPNSVFGYQGRYDEYRQLPSRISADMRSTDDHWHMARIFSGDVALNSSFIQCNPSKRIQADTAADTFRIMSAHSIQARRPIAKQATPRLVL